MPRRPPARKASVSNRLRHALGLRQWFVIDGVRYREITSESMRRSLSRKGPGFKEYEAIFADGSSMVIHATAKRVFADLSGSEPFAVLQRAEPLILPGMRLLLIPGGTGYGGQW